jgi:hypothetical protein
MLEKEIINFEKTAIVGIVTQNQSEDKLNEYLDELEFLTFTAGGEVVKRFWHVSHFLLLRMTLPSSEFLESRTFVSGAEQ